MSLVANPSSVLVYCILHHSAPVGPLTSRLWLLTFHLSHLSPPIVPHAHVLLYLRLATHSPLAVGESLVVNPSPPSSQPPTPTLPLDDNQPFGIDSQSQQNLSLVSLSADSQGSMLAPVTWRCKHFCTLACLVSHPLYVYHSCPHVRPHVVVSQAL